MLVVKSALSYLNALSTYNAVRGAFAMSGEKFIIQH